MAKSRAGFPVEIIDDAQIPIPIHVYIEPRRNVRISISQGYANLRLPLYLSIEQKTEYLIWARDWLVKKYKKEPSLSAPQSRTYKDGDEIVLMEQQFFVHIRQHSSSKLEGKIKENNFSFHVPLHWEERQTQEGISTLLRKMVAQRMRSEMIHRVIHLNRLHFNKDISGLKLKYNTSNWGSCSRKKNLNFSTRLLLAPQEVIDYVIIHELAHLIEMNHSSKFWNLVEKADPGYKKKEVWLKMHGAKLII